MSATGRDASGAAAAASPTAEERTPARPPLPRWRGLLPGTGGGGPARRLGRDGAGRGRGGGHRDRRRGRGGPRRSDSVVSGARLTGAGAPA